MEQHACRSLISIIIIHLIFTNTGSYGKQKEKEFL
jgi:hypothetical protein